MFMCNCKAFYEFENMFGYRLRSNVADPEEVDIMLKKVYRLLNHILNIDYDIFEPNNKDNWESTLDYFYKYMEVVENEARVVLDQCIDSLKSAEQGLELIAYMGKAETRDKLLQHLMSKRESVMKKFVIEVGIVEHEFLVSSKLQTIHKIIKGNEHELLCGMMMQRGVLLNFESFLMLF